VIPQRTHLSLVHRTFSFGKRAGRHAFERAARGASWKRDQLFGFMSLEAMSTVIMNPFVPLYSYGLSPVR
jgi:hypothetical protein